MVHKRAPPDMPEPAMVLKTLRCQIAGAVMAIEKNPALSDADVHQIRKILKRARSSLRLLRDSVGKSRYTRENARLRDAARCLGPVRDAQAALEALSTVATLAHASARRTSLLKLKHRLLKSHADMLRELNTGSVSRKAARLIGASQQSVGKWRLPRNDTSILRSGLKRIYRRGRCALAAVRSERSDETLHELRKQAKYLWQAMEVFRLTGTRFLSVHVKSVQSIADWLGDDHDLAVLRRTIDALDRDTQKVDMDLLAHVEHRRKELQISALKMCRRVYAETAKRYIANTLGPCI